MSEEYVRKNNVTELPITDPEMRDFCKRPGKTNPDGSPCYFTQQSHKSECDINKIIARYDTQGVLTHVSKFEAKFGDMTGLDFKYMADKVANAKTMFALLPSDIRTVFENDPGKLLEFMEDPNNRDKAIELGLIDESTPIDLDGLGEHVQEPAADPGIEPTPE